MDLDFATVKTLTKVESSVYREMNHKPYQQLEAEERACDMDNREAVATALDCLRRKGLTYSINYNDPTHLRIEGRKVDWAMALSIVSLLRDGVPTSKIRVILGR